jgi:hypothetical protein
MGALALAAGADHVSSLSLAEAVLLSAPEPTPFFIAPRLTQHVRHRQKYLDVPVADRFAFVFTEHGQPFGCHARTLTEFGELLSISSEQALGAHLDRGDVSRWVGDVFGDHVLAKGIGDLERSHRLRQPLDAADGLRQLIDERYTRPDEL